jgi:hypothetical protein
MGYSSAISLTDAGTTHVCCVNKDGANTYFKVTKRNLDQSIFVLVEDCPAPY